MQRSTRRASGFTLIELMITVAIVGILAAVAYPSYLTYLTKSNRRAAQSFLLEVSSRQQRYLLDARSYAADLATLQMSTPPDVSRNYTITTAPKAGTTPPGFTATATPKGTQATRDAGCGNLSIDETGAKTASGGGATCW
jgi:type IV pilus assembly protein PilE